MCIIYRRKGPWKYHNIKKTSIKKSLSIEGLLFHKTKYIERLPFPMIPTPTNPMGPDKRLIRKAIEDIGKVNRRQSNKNSDFNPLI